MSRIQNSFVVPHARQTGTTEAARNTGIVPPQLVKSASSALSGLEKDVFDGASKLLSSLGVKDAGSFLGGIAKDLGFQVADRDGDAAGKIDDDGMVVPNADGKTTAQPTATSAPDLQYYGGKVLNKFQVENVYYGSSYNTSAGKADASYNDGFMKQYVGNKDAESVWHQYGVSGGSFDGSTVVNKKVRSGQKVTQAAIEKLVKSLAAKDPNAGDNKIFNIVLPPGAVLDQGGTTSKQGLGGYHGSVSVNGKQVYYSAICDSKGNNGIDFTNGDTRGNVSITESHEISEAVTDPDVEVASKSNDWTKLGWMDPNNGEIGDLEVNDAAPGTPLSTMFGKSNGYDVQKIWSQKDHTNEIKAKSPGSVQPLPKPATPPGN